MNEKKINKNLLLIFRIICALVGAAVGIVAIWQVFEMRPDLVKDTGLRVVFYFACGALPAAVLLLSAKPLLSLILSLCDRIKVRFKGVNAADVAGVLLGIVIGMFFGFVSELVMRLFLNIFALRIVIAVVLALVAAYFFSLLCLGFVKKAEEKDDACEDAPKYTGEDGYVLTDVAFRSDKVVNVCENWLTGNVFVLDSTVGAVVGREDANSVAAESARRLKVLLDAEKIKSVSFDCGAEDEDDRVISFAYEKNLKILVENRRSVKETSIPVSLLALDEL